ncbi:MAG TPA: Sapep family Mn(2+)-dependent dipeptidase [Limnochordales bacterium]
MDRLQPGEASGPLEQRVERWLERHARDLVEQTAALVRIPSVEGPPEPGHPFGREVGQALAYVAGLARSLGLETLDVDGYAIHAHWGPSEPLVGVLGHVDVVPAGSGWSVPPFGGVVRDGRVWGRGALDDKGPTVAALFAAAALAAAGAPVRRGIRLIVGGDEETGFQCLRHYFARQPRPEVAFAPDALFPVVFAEKGILNLTVALPAGSAVLARLAGGSRPNVVPDTAEAELVFPSAGQAGAWQERLARAARGRRAQLAARAAGERVTLSSQGVATHGSTPEKGVNAAAELLAWLVEADEGQGVLDPGGSLAFLARAGSGLHGEGLGIFTRDDVSGVLTCNLGVLSLREQELVATFDIRYPVSLGRADGLVARVEQALRAQGGRVVAVSDDPPHHVPEDSWLVRTLLEVYRRETGGDLPPLAIGGGTYARLLPQAVAFGPVEPMSGAVPHEKDEHIEVSRLQQLARIYAAALWELAR